MLSSAMLMTSGSCHVPRAGHAIEPDRRADPDRRANPCQLRTIGRAVAVDPECARAMRRAGCIAKPERFLVVLYLRSRRSDHAPA
jgi:hypothetical protein